MELLKDLNPRYDDAQTRADYFREQPGDEREPQEFRRVENAEVKAVNDDEKSIVYVITSPAVDRYGEIVDPNGLDLKNFRRSKRTVFWNHDYNRVIGRSMWEKRDGDNWLGKVQFAADATDFAADIWRLAKGGFVGMTSIGFIPKAWEWKKLSDMKEEAFKVPNAKDADKDAEHLIHRKAEMVEYSVVGIGANPDAVELQKMLGVVRSPEMQNRLALAVQEKRVCELEDCRSKMETTLEETLEAMNLRLTESEATKDALLLEIGELKEKLNKLHATSVEMTARKLSPDEIAHLVNTAVGGVISRYKGKV